MQSAAAVRVDTVVTPALRVLIVDDSAALRTLTRFVLSARLGFTIVAEAAAGEEAVGLVELHRPDCVVLDIEMPGIGGMAALEQIRQRHPETPVVMLSGYADAAVTEAALSAGASALLDKDKGMARLGETLRAAVERVAPTAPQPAGPAHDPDAVVSLAELRRLEYVVGHDFAEPLRTMKGFATLLHGRYAEELDESGRSFLMHIVAGATRMQAMVDDLLTYSRASLEQPRRDVVELSSLVTQARTALAPWIAEHGGLVDVGALPPVVGDARLLTTVLQHLISNAIAFNTSPVPSVRIAGSHTDQLVTVTVADNGIGIDAAQHEAVFALFRRLNTSQEYSGTGTGLALCRRLVELQAGAIRLESAPGAGTTVILTLPSAPRHQGEPS